MQHTAALQAILLLAQRKGDWVIPAICALAEEALEIPANGKIRHVVDPGITLQLPPPLMPANANAPARRARKAKATPTERKPAKDAADDEKGAGAPLNDIQRKVLRHLEGRGPRQIAQLAIDVGSKAGPLARATLPFLRERGLLEESDGFWRCTERGAEVALDA